MLNSGGYICSGAIASSNYTSEVNQYNDSMNVWFTKNMGGTARYETAGFSLNGFGYVCNGSTASQTNEVNQYVPNDNIPTLSISMFINEY